MISRLDNISPPPRRVPVSPCRWVATGDLDALGNITGLANGTASSLTRTYNAQNQMTGMETAGGNVTLAYDNNGNTVADDQGHTLVYDAWNRLVAVHDSSGGPIASYSYDGFGRRITATEGGATSEQYFSGLQIVEERRIGNVTFQNVWSSATSSVLRDSFSGGSLSERLYMTRDADSNITAAVTTSGGISQRMVYDAYGSVDFRGQDWSSGNNTKSLVNLYQDMRLGTAIGWYFTDTRLYSPTEMRFNRVDPAGYINGPNDFLFEGASPIARLDPSGLLSIDSAGNKLLQAIDAALGPGLPVAVDASDLRAGGRLLTGGWAVDFGITFASTHRGDIAGQHGLKREDIENAARHAAWQAELTWEYGANTAKQVGDIHEKYSSDFNDSSVDQYNNAIARALMSYGPGLEAKSTADVEGIVRDALEHGYFVFSQNDPRVLPGKIKQLEARAAALEAKNKDLNERLRKLLRDSPDKELLDVLRPLLPECPN